MDRKGDKSTLEQSPFDVVPPIEILYPFSVSRLCHGTMIDKKLMAYWWNRAPSRSGTENIAPRGLQIKTYLTAKVGHAEVCGRRRARQARDVYEGERKGTIIRLLPVTLSPAQWRAIAPSASVYESCAPHASVHWQHNDYVLERLPISSYDIPCTRNTSFEQFHTSQAASEA